ncbi:MAG: ribonuclease III [Clostridiales bacterium]|nr:ribonuclease III [Clostridiales bacterium]
MFKILNPRKIEFEEFEKKIGYVFNKKYILNRALTHSSYANQAGLSYIEHNERLEFLGDSVLSLITSEFIFNKYKRKPEGKLSKIRACIVCETSLYESAQKINIGRYLLMSKGEELTGGRDRTSILADAFEALIAAIYLDGGIESARKFIFLHHLDNIKDIRKNKRIKDYKTILQEYVQKETDSKIRYELIDEMGPDHDKTFYVQVSINGNISGKGNGKSKKEAEQEAAKDALKRVPAKK